MTPTTDPLAEYARIWLSRKGAIIMPTFPGWLRLGAELLQDFEAGTPGITVHLRSAAREALGSSDDIIVQKGIRLLAILGTRDDLAALGRLRSSHAGAVATDARSAIFEIEHRTRTV